MDWANPVAAGINVGGNLLGSMMGGSESRAAARRQMKAMLYMSNTAHQREVKDLREAGLNPILSANSGASAGTPGQAAVPDYGAAIASGAGHAISAIQARSALKGQKQEQEQREMNLKLQRGMMDWLEEHPELRALVYSAKLSHELGMNPTVVAPVVAAHSALKEREVGRRFGDWLWKKGVEAYQEKEPYKPDKADQELWIGPDGKLNILGVK